MRLYVLLCCWVCAPFFSIHAQILTLTPSNPTLTDSITLIYDASQGNATLANFTGDIYAHTGLLTAASTSINDWRRVVAAWNQNLPALRLIPLGNNRFQLRFQIQGLYNPLASEEVIALAFVFRNTNGTVVGRTESNNDILYYLTPPSAIRRYASHTLSANGELRITTDSGAIVAIQTLGDELIQVSNFVNANTLPDTSYSRILTGQNFVTSLTNNAQYLQLNTNTTNVIIRKNPLKVLFVQNGDTLLQEKDAAYFARSSGAKGIRFALSNTEMIYGTGARALPQQRRGRRWTMYNNANYGYSYGADNLNLQVPFVTSNRGYGLFVDNHWSGYLDAGSSDYSTLEYGIQNGQMSYVFVGGKTYSKILDNYTRLTGKQPLPPRWALGYIQSKYGYQTRSEAETIVNNLQAAQFPIDALVLDLYWFGSPSTMGNLDWDLSRFPNPSAMMGNWRIQGVKTILITEPYFTQQSRLSGVGSSSNYFAKNASGSTYLINNFWAGSSALLDISKTDAQHWFWQQYQARHDEGVGGWWSDLGEPEAHPEDMLMQGGVTRKIHNVYSLLWQKMLFEKYRANYPNERLFNLARSGWAGSQRYGVIPWSGDIQRTFEGMRAQVPLMLGAAMSGIGYMSSDLGGFTGSNQLQNELYTRWLQMGAFTPIMRAHGADVPTEPTAYSAQTQSIVRKYSQLRYALLPYNYTLAYENTVKGIPLARPMDFYELQNTALQNLNDQYFWGENMLVAPVLTQGQTTRNVRFPTGRWLDWERPTANIYEANTSANVTAPIEKLPIFVRAGSFVPMVRGLLNTERYRTDTLVIRYFLDLNTPQSNYTMYDDDGKNPDALNNQQFQLLQFEGSVTASTTQIHYQSSGNFATAPALRQLFFELPTQRTRPQTVLQDGIALANFSNYGTYQSASNGWFWDDVNSILHIHIAASGVLTNIDISNTITSLAQTESATTFKLYPTYPNPATDELVIPFDLGANTERLTLQLFNSTATECLYQKILPMARGSHEWRLPIAHLPTGFYWVRLSVDDQIRAMKWVKM